MRQPNGYQFLPSEDREGNVNLKLPKPQRNSFRLELQGLRAVAIIAVLLFHSWGSVFQTGFLGVDVFFVLSGYLMCQLLSRKMPLELDDVLDFYFRRIKRIVPIYLFIIGLTVVVARHYVSRLDYQQLIDETIPSMFFYSNFPSVHKTQYFDLRSKYFFLLHTWSLSVEMQFYLIVPVLFLIAQKIQKPYLLWTFGILLFGASFLRQCLAEGVAKHMGLDARMWQFLSGFLAFIAFEFIQPYASYKGLKWVAMVGSPVLKIAVVSILLVLLLVKLSPLNQLTRYCVILYTMIFVALLNGENSLLSVDALISLGDASYSVYLIHWPIFALHRSVHSEMYNDKGEASHIVGLLLIIISVSLGCLVEKCWRRISVTNWYSLIITMLALYACIGILLFDISQKSIRMDNMSSHFGTMNGTAFNPNVSNVDHKPPWIREDGSVDEVAKITEELWRQRYNPQPILSKEAIARNLGVLHYGEQNAACPESCRVLPVKYSERVRALCTEKGRGTKNIVIVGNSHAYTTYYGIRRHFLDLAANISLVSTAVCTPVPEELQQPTFGPHVMSNCAAYINETVEMFRQWNYSIDIIITMYGFHGMQDQPPVTDWETDPMFTFMQNYYQQLGEIAREAVFIPVVSIRFNSLPMKELSKKLLNNGIIEEMGETLESQLNYLPNMRKRMEHIKCPKCVTMDFHKLWCRAHQATFCQSVEPVSNIAYFIDDHHPSPYGSMFLGEFVRQKYDQFIKKQKNRCSIYNLRSCIPL